MSEEVEAAADAEMFPSPQRTAAPPRGIKRSSIKWPVVATTGVVVVLVLSTMATSWQRQHYGTSIQWSTRRSRAHSGVGSRARAAIESMGGELRDQTLAAATEAREQLEQLAASIEQPMGAAGALGGGSGFAADAAGHSMRRPGGADTQALSAKQVRHSRGGAALDLPVRWRHGVCHPVSFWHKRALAAWAPGRRWRTQRAAAGPPSLHTLLLQACI